MSFGLLCDRIPVADTNKQLATKNTNHYHGFFSIQNMIQGKTCQDKTKKHEKTQLTKCRLELPLFIPSSG